MLNENTFSDMERDVIGEVMNISLGSSATSLSALLGKRVEITVPTVNVISAKDFSYENLEPAIGVEINYVAGLDGTNLMIWKRVDAKTIIEILLGKEIPVEEFEMDEINISAICEVMNQMMGSAATALSDFLGKVINISTPVAYEIDDKTEFRSKYFSEDEVIVAVSFQLFIEDSVQSQFINVMPAPLAREIISGFLKSSENVEGNGDDNVFAEKEALINKEDETGHVEEYADEDEKVKQDTYSEQVKVRLPKKNVQNKRQHVPVAVKPVALDTFDEEETLSEEQLSNLEMIMSVPLEISVEIGNTKKLIKDILEFSQGTIVELDKQAGALVDIIVNGQLIAKGEVVVVNDNFGVRIVEIIKKDELMKLTL